MARAAERRAHPRAAFRAWVEIAMEGRRFLGRGRDLSQGGISVWLDGHLPRVGSQLDGEFQLPGIQLPLMLRARVAWTEPASGHVGLLFEQMDPSVGELLENYVAGRF